MRDADVRSLITLPEAVDVVARGVIAAARDHAAAARSTIPVGDGWLRIMSGTLPAEDVLGYKAFHLIPRAGVRYVCALYRLSTGEPLALIDANYLTIVRTSAAAAAAAARRWSEQPIRVAMIGTGTYARYGLRTLASVCRLATVRVFSPRQESRDRFARELECELDAAVSTVTEPARATQGADMALCATVTGGRLALNACDLGDVRYVSSIGSTLPTQIELDPAVVARAGRLVLDTRDALEESGDLLAARAAGLDESRITLLANYLDGPRDHVPLTVYKSIGSVEQDLALAAALWRSADRRGCGEVVDAIESGREVPGS